MTSYWKIQMLKLESQTQLFHFILMERSHLSQAPASLEINKNVNGGRVVLNGYNKTKSTKSININASYSKVRPSKIKNHFEAVVSQSQNDFFY